MANSSTVNVNNNLSCMLLELRRHFATCRLCESSVKAREYDLVCQWTKRRILEIASRWQMSITMRLQLKRDSVPHVFPCPDLNKHGAAYAAVAEPVVVTMVQGVLF